MPNNGQGECYFNAGMLVINLQNWRKENITNKCIDYLNKYDVAFPDQDVLNMVLFDRVKFVSVSWNFNSIVKKVLLEKIYNLDNKTEQLKNLIKPVINDDIKVDVYHYYGQPKPWWKVPFYFIRGQLGLIESCYLEPYLEMAFNTPIYGEFFVKNLSHLAPNVRVFGGKRQDTWRQMSGSLGVNVSTLGAKCQGV